MTLTHWKKLENPDYIGSYAFQPGELKTVTISRVDREIVPGPDGKKEECTIVHFVENEKPLILNATNGKMISKLAGTPFIEQWKGHRIVLGVEKVKAFGDVVEAVRVKKDKPTAASTSLAKPAEIPLCTDCGGTIEAVGNVAAERIVAAGMKRYGAALCMECAKKRAERADSMKEDEANADDQNQDQ